MSDQLPPGWAPATIEQIAEVNPLGSTTTVSDDQLVTFLPMAAVEELTGRIRLDTLRRFGDVKKGFTRFRDGDVLFAKITPCMENGKVAVVRDLERGVGCGSTEFHVLRPRPGVEADYLRHFLVRASFRQDAKRNMQGAVGQQRVPVDYLREASIPLAPSKEQERIVSRIEELFSEIEEGERALERVQKLVERYRQSVLRAAVTGELTREWREKHRGPLESGEALLQRILKARCGAWETAELAKMKAVGQKPTDDKWKRRYQEPLAPDAAQFPPLPQGWTCATVEQLCFVETGATPKRGERKYFDGGTVDWITSSAVNDAVIRSASERITDLAVEETNAKPFPVGTLIVAMYGEGKTRGKVSELGIVAATNQACAGLLTAHLDPEARNYLRTFLESHYLELRAKAAGGVQPNLNLSILKDTVVPLPPRGEALAVCEAVAIRQSQLVALRRDCSTWEMQATALRHKVLAHAFEGRLVAQQSADEPAADLLGRLRDLRAAEQELTRVRSGRSKTKPLAQVMKEHGVQPQAQRRTRAPRGV